MVYPESISQHTEESITTPDGRYDFTRLSAHEREVVQEVLAIADSAKYPKKLKGLGLANESYGIVYKPRYILHEIIVQRCGMSNNPYDMLAVAAAYKTKGAIGREKAIEYYEKYLNAADMPQKKTAAEYFHEASEPFFSYRLSELYEQAGRLPEALSYAYRAYEKRLPGAVGYPLRIGSVLMKTDVSECVRFYSGLLGSAEFAECDIIRSEYGKAVERKKRGYQYRPRLYKPSEQNIQMEKEIAKAALEFTGSSKKRHSILPFFRGSR